MKKDTKETAQTIFAIIVTLIGVFFIGYGVKDGGLNQEDVNSLMAQTKDDIIKELKYNNDVHLNALAYALGYEYKEEDKNTGCLSYTEISYNKIKK
jgi:hypothetical protein